MEANWLARILDDIEGYARENGIESLMTEVRKARRITSLELGTPDAGLDAPSGSPSTAARPDSGLAPPAEG